MFLKIILLIKSKRLIKDTDEDFQKFSGNNLKEKKITQSIERKLKSPKTSHKDIISSNDNDSHNESDSTYDDPLKDKMADIDNVEKFSNFVPVKNGDKTIYLPFDTFQEVLKDKSIKKKKLIILRYQKQQSRKN